MQRTRHGWRWLWLVALVVAAFGLVACADDNGDDTGILDGTPNGGEEGEDGDALGALNADEDDATATPEDEADDGDGAATATGTAGAAEAGGGEVVMVTIDDATIHLAPSTVGAGEVAFDVANDGESEHELIFVRSEEPATALPLADDGTVDTSELDVVHELDAVEPGEMTTETVDLEPGRYLIFSNLEGDYEAGLVAELTVE